MISCDIHMHTWITLDLHSYIYSSKLNIARKIACLYVCVCVHKCEVMYVCMYSDSVLIEPRLKLCCSVLLIFIAHFPISFSSRVSFSFRSHSFCVAFCASHCCRCSLLLLLLLSSLPYFSFSHSFASTVFSSSSL